MLFLLIGLVVVLIIQWKPSLLSVFNPPATNSITPTITTTSQNRIPAVFSKKNPNRVNNVNDSRVINKNIRKIIDDYAIKSISDRSPDDMKPVSANMGNFPNIEAPQQENTSDNTLGKYTEIIIKLKTNNTQLSNYSSTTASNGSSFASLGIKQVEKIQGENLLLITFQKDIDVKAKIEELKNDVDIEFYQPNYQYVTQAIPSNDANRGQLWGLDNTGQTIEGTSGIVDADIDFPEAYAYGPNGLGVIVAVIDSGVNYLHSDLIQSMWDGSGCVDDLGTYLGGCIHGYDYEDDDKDPMPYIAHGTHVAGTIGATMNNGIGILGVSPKARIMALKTDLTTASVIKAINFATKNGAKVINASWGGGEEDMLLKEAISTYPGIFVAAAGNYSTDHIEYPFYPCDYDLNNIVCVAATDQRDSLAYFSDYGITQVDLGAPGENIYSTIIGYIPVEKYSENFESTSVISIPTGWTRKDVNDTIGVVNVGGSWGNSLIGDYIYPYSKNITNAVISKTIALEPNDSAELSFWIGCDTEYSNLYYGDDYMSVWISNDDGATYDLIDNYNEYWLDDDDIEGNNANGFASAIVSWSMPSSFITNTMKLGIEWKTDGDSNVGGGYGCIIDNVIFSQYKIGNESYDYYNGTSMATPHVVGAFASLFSMLPSISNAQAKSLILNSTDKISSLNGKTVSGGRLNLNNVLLTASRSLTPSVTPSATPTQSPTPTLTGAPTLTPTITPTNTPTGTPTQTPTNTPTGTPAHSPTPTPTGEQISSIDVKKTYLSTSLVDDKVYNTYGISVTNKSSSIIENISIVDGVSTGTTIFTTLTSDNVDWASVNQTFTISSIDPWETKGAVIAVEIPISGDNCPGYNMIEVTQNGDQISTKRADGNVAYCEELTPTPTLTPTLTPTPTTTPTSTPTLTPTPTTDPNVTVTATPTTTLTPTLTPTTTITPTSSITTTPIPTTTNAPTSTPDPLLTGTPIPTTTPVLGSIGDFVWEDTNNNSLYDAGEGPISGLNIQLIRCGDATVALSNTTTNGQGIYTFNNLDRGCYRVKFYPSTSYSACKQHADSSKTGIDSDADPTGMTQDVNLASGESNLSIDACFVKIRTTTHVSLSQTIDKTEPNLWDNIMYTLTVKNDGAYDATAIKVKDYWPSGLLYSSHDAVGDNTEVYDPKDGMWNVGTVTKGQSKMLRIMAKVSSITNTTNIAEIYSMSEKNSNSTPNNLVTTEDDYASTTIIPKLNNVASEQKNELANTGVASMLTFGFGSSLLVAAIAIEELRSRVRFNQDEEDE